jgi:hypothetical protein
MGKGSLGRAGSHGLLGVPGAHGGSCILRDIPLESSFNTIFTFAPLAPFRAHLEEPVMSKEIISTQESAGTLAAYSQGVGLSSWPVRDLSIPEPGRWSEQPSRSRLLSV